MDNELPELIGNLFGSDNLQESESEGTNNLTNQRNSENHNLIQGGGGGGGGDGNGGNSNEEELEIERPQEPLPSTSGQRSDERTVRQSQVYDSENDSEDEFLYDEPEILQHHLNLLRQNEHDIQGRNQDENISSAGNNLLNENLKRIAANFQHIKIINFKQEAQFKKILKKDFCKIRLLETSNADKFARSLNEICIFIRAGENVNFIKIKLFLNLM